MDGIDLREYQDSDEIKDLFGKLVSGKNGYKSVIEKRKEIKNCSDCNKILEGGEKFCPECGKKQ